METFLKSRAGAVKMGTPLMILCFFTVAGFLYWLSITAEPTEVVIEEPEEVVENEVAFADFSAGPAGYIGQEIMLRAVSMESLLGPHAFWTNLSDEQRTPYLLHLSEGLLADSMSVMDGDTVDVNGMVVAMSDSVLNAWAAAGAFPNEIDRTLAEFAENFIEVLSIDGVEASEASESSESSEPSS